MRYAKYKPTNIPWLPEVPETWEAKPLRHFLTPVSKKGFQDKQLLSVTRESGVIVRDIESKESNHNFIPDDLSNYKLVEKGDFAVNKMKSWQGSYGVSEYDGIVSPAYFVFKLRNVYSKFFSIAIRSKAYISFFARFSKGIRVDQWDLSLVAIKEIPFLLPPLAEQKRIVAYLDEKCAKIDTLVTAKTKQIELFKELRQSIIAEAVTKGIDGCKTFKPTNIPWLPEVPETWEVKKMKYHFYERSEKGHPDEVPLCSTQAYGVIPQSMYENRIVIVDAKNLAQLKLVKKGDFVISLRAFQGGIEIAHYQGIISAAYTILELRDKANSNYFRWLFKSRPFIGLLKTCVTGIREGQNINYPLLSQKSLPLPPLAEQKRIVAYLDEKCAKIDTLVAKIEDEVIKLKEYRERLVADVVTGQRKVVK